MKSVCAKFSREVLFDIIVFFFHALFRSVLKMGRHKKKDPNIDLKSVKQGLASIIRPEYRAGIIAYVSDLSIRATKIASLASLFFLMLVIIRKMNIIVFLAYTHEFP